MQEWTSHEIPIEIPTYVIIQVGKKNKRWHYIEHKSGYGGWTEAVWEMYDSFGQFKDEVAGSKNNKEIHERLDNIAMQLEQKGMPYEFKLPDFTDFWYVAYAKNATYKIEHSGEIS